MAEGKRLALLVATEAYADPGLTTLRSPTGDVQALAQVLEDGSIGGFQVRQLVNRSTDELKQEIEGFFEDARLQDLLVLYVSGHGVLSQNRRFYFATATTKLTRLRATAIEDSFVHDVIQHSRARSIVLMLDCCHSGAFAKGFAPKGATHVDVEHRFGKGRGRVTLTASTDLEYAFEEAESQHPTSLGASPPSSLFTRYLVEGLKTGSADIDEDGDISIDELYEYIYDRVRERSRDQTPGKSGAGHGEIVIGRSPHQSSLPAALRQALGHPLAPVREAGIDELARVRPMADPARAASIDEALRRALNDGSSRVRLAAEAVLIKHGAGPPSADATSSAPAVTEGGDKPLADTGSAEARRGPAGQRPRRPASPSRSQAPPTAVFERARELVRLPHDHGVNAVAFSVDGTRVATACRDGSARVWDVAARSWDPVSCRELLSLAHDRGVTDVTFESEGTHIATASLDTTARVWDATSGHELGRLSHDGHVHSVAFSGNGTWIATAGEDHAAHVWDRASNREVARLAHDGTVLSVAFSPDSAHMVTASTDYTARIWDTGSGLELVRLTHFNFVNGAAFNPDGAQVITVSFDKTARVWDRASGQELARLIHRTPLGGVAVSPDGAQILTAGYDSSARVWDIATGRELARLAHDDFVVGVAFHPDGKQIGTAVSGHTRHVPPGKRRLKKLRGSGLSLEEYGYAVLWGP